MIDHARFKPTGIAGCKWDRRAKKALFDVVFTNRSRRQRVRRVVPFESVEAAKSGFARFKSKIKSDAALDGAPNPVETAKSPSTVAEYVSEHWASLHVRCGASTIKTNAKIWRLHLEPFFGTLYVSDVAESHCEDFSAMMRARKYSAYTTNLALRVLRKILHHARRRNLRTAVPENFHFQKETLLRLELNESEQERFFAAFEDEDAFRKDLAERRSTGKVVRSAHFGFKERRFGGGLKPDSRAASVYFERFRRARWLFVAAVDLGLRGPSDLRLLRRSAVDLDRGIVSITTVKTGRSANVPLSNRCREVLARAMSERVSNSEYVFVTPEGRPFCDKTLRGYFSLAKKLAGITRRCRLNDLRHTFGSNLASEGVSLIEIRDALGHTTTRTTERYAKPDARSLERVREALNRLGQQSGGSDTRSDGEMNYG